MLLSDGQQINRILDEKVFSSIESDEGQKCITVYIFININANQLKKFDTLIKTKIVKFISYIKQGIFTMIENDVVIYD